jgi:pimeloyl-ACP methyl ester carboxylesterase
MKLSFFEWKSEQPTLKAPLVFLHGLGGTGNIWRPITAKLEDEFLCIAPDQRGHGASRPVPAGEENQFHAIDYAKDVSTLLVSLNIQRYTLIGHSMGVRTALALAQLEPEKVAGLIAVDIGISSRWGGGIGLPLAHFVQNLPEVFSSRAQLRDYVMKHCPDPSIGQYLAAVSFKSSESPETWAFPFDHQSLVATIEEANEAPIPDYLRKILAAKIPTLFLRGANSRVWLKEDYEQQKTEFADENLNFEEWEDCGHGLPFEKRVRFIERIKTFLIQKEANL